MENLRFLISSGASGANNYVRACAAVGAEAKSIYLPEVDLSYDALILSGGGDMDPARFGQEWDGTEEVDAARDAAELALFEAYFAAGKPILGICRGHQVINVALGGTLIQHLKEKTPVHRPSEGQSGDRIHSVTAMPGSWYEKQYGPVFSVNSYHHQAIGRLGKDLYTVVESADGVIEAVEHRFAPIISTQFHPERLMLELKKDNEVDGTAIFERFVRLCRTNRGN